MVKNKLVIHIGFGKTGTSSLQRFFVLNSDKLQSLGVYYPVTGRQDLNAHHYMATSVRPGGGTGFDTDVSWEDYLQQLTDELEGRTEPTILISSEIFSGKVVFGQLKKLTDIFSEIQVVSYLRRQDVLSISSYNQWVKTESLGCEFGDLKVLPYHYDKVLELWDNTFRILGAEKVNIVRPYEKGELYKDDVLDDFMHYILGAEIDETYVCPGKDEENTRLSLDTLEYKRIVNSFCPADIAADILKPLLQYAEHHVLADATMPKTSTISSQQQRELLLHYADGNAVVASKYLGRDDGVLFRDAELPADQDWDRHVLTLEKAVDISRYILHFKYSGVHKKDVLAIISKALKFKCLSSEAKHEKFDENVKEISAKVLCAKDKIEAVIRECVYDIYGKFSDKTEDDLIAQRWTK